jgi:hypothetical protein
VVFGAINLLEATVAFLLLRRWRFNPRFAVPSDITKFLIAGAVLSGRQSREGGPERSLDSVDSN